MLGNCNWRRVLSDASFDKSYIKVLVWLIPVVFGAGGVYAHVSRASADVADVRAEISAHTKEGVGHTATQVRLDRIETNQAQILTQQRRTAESVAAICQATGANCK